MTFTSMHWPLSAYASALAVNGMMISALSEGGDAAIPWGWPPRLDLLKPLC